MSKTILIIEDDADVIEIMAYILKDEGYQVVLYRDSQPIVEMVLVIRPDLILMDNRLPGPSGKDKCRELKEDSTTCHIPVALVSTHQHLAEFANECLADGFIGKPFDLMDLTTTAQKYLGK